MRPALSVVRFTTAAGSYAVDIEVALEVVEAARSVALPAPEEGTAGFVERAGTLCAVSNALGPGSRHVLVLQGDGAAFGVAADEVERVEQVDPARLRPPPPGQRLPLVAATYQDGPITVLVVDVAVLGRQLQHGQGHGPAGASTLMP